MESCIQETTKALFFDNSFLTYIVSYHQKYLLRLKLSIFLN